MNQDVFIRCALIAAAVCNFSAAVVFAFPSSLGRLAALPSAPPLYTSLVAFFVALFGGCYAWLAVQPTLHKLLVAFAAIGKSIAFVLFSALWLT